jgi:flagellar protein FlaG
MINSISSSHASGNAAAPANAAPQAHPVASEAAQIKAPEKAKLSLDTKEMQRNLQEAIARLNEQMQKNGRDLRFSVDKELDRAIITVKSNETGQVVRQIPNEVVIKIAHNIENVKGLLHNESI